MRVGLALRLLCGFVVSTAVFCAGSLVLAENPSPVVDPQLVPVQDSSGQQISDVVIEGNITIPDVAILQKVKSQPGRTVTPEMVREDIRTLYATRWFFSIEPRFRQSETGMTLVFRVSERPILESVEFRGNDKIKTKYLTELTGLKPGGPYDVSANRESVRRILAHYESKGYRFAKVELQKGDSPDDRSVIFVIDEGPKVIVTKIGFEGNEFFSSELLKTKLQTKKAFLGISFLGGKYDPSSITNDVASLRQYYNSLGFFDATIEPDIKFTEDQAHVHVTYRVTEGVRYQVRNLTMMGNTLFNEDELLDDIDLEAGEFFNGRELSAGVTKIRERYGERGHLYASVDPVPHFLEEPGKVDMMIRIDEDRPYRIRKVNVHIRGDRPHTKESVVLNQLSRARVRPGMLANPEHVRLSKSRLEGSQLFERGPELGPEIKLTQVDPLKEVEEHRVIRGQSDVHGIPQPTNPLWATSPQGDPYNNSLIGPPPGWVDVDTYVSEARTGRLMFGVGVNSSSGVVGNIVLNESNFDILRPPTSFHDLVDGSAWRGAGQQFRIEAIPGNEVSRYLVSWTDPFFLNTDWSLGVSGFYFTRFYTDWNEDRLGGRVTLGKQITPEVSLTGALRLEQVDLSRPTTPTPGILAEAVGDNFLSSFRLSLAHDTRDAAYLPGHGHYVELAAEQAFGEFNYPRLELEASQYFTTFERPDGAGRHILQLRGQLGWTDTATPVFERYYAGGFQTFRGFRFRGVTPRQGNVGVGGQWMLLTGAEYSFPMTASEMVRGVAFTDMGTVENDVALNDFRVSVGAVPLKKKPARGPAPITLDFPYPLAIQESDDRQIFSFYVGMSR